MNKGDLGQLNTGMITIRRVKWRDSLRVRLSIAIGTAVLAGILLISGWMSLFAFSSSVEATRARMNGVAAVMATVVAPAMATNDVAAMQKALTSIRDLPDVSYVGVTDTEFQPVAAMGSGTYLDSSPGNDGQVTGKSALFASTMWLRADIVSGGVPRGHVFLLADMRAQRDQFVRAIALNAALALAVALGTALIVFRTINIFTRPLSALAGMMSGLASDGRYDRRAEVRERGEVAVLADSFNAMIAQIERRDRDLNDYRVHLEERVEHRTQELRAATQAAEKANAAKSDFLATMSHEIRTPLNGMMVMAEMLAIAPLPERQKHYADVINRSGRGLLAIINDVLDYSKIEAGHVDLETIPFAIDTIFADSGTLFAERAREKGLALLTAVDPQVARTLAGDPTRIGQIVTNLVNNAIKFTREGGIVVRAGLKHGARSAPGHQTLEISVTDTGIGIPSEKIATIFDAFAQAEQSTSREYGGTGLGLAICRNLAQAMGGSIHVESAVGKGSTFTLVVELPVVEAASSRPALDGLSIGVVSSRPFVQSTLERILSAQGASVPGISGPFSLKSIKADFVIVDEGTLPDPDLLAHLVEAKIPVIALCWSFSGSGLHRDSGLSATGAITLPLSRDKLCDLGKAARTGNWAAISGARKASAGRAPRLPDFSRFAVLAVDDGAVNREVVCEALSAFGIVCDVAHSGPQAISMAAERDYDVIFMDCSMPGMDGFEATRIIRANEAARGAPRAVIAALTAHVLGEKSERYRDADMDAWIPKPFTLTDISAFLETVSQGIHNVAMLRPEKVDHARSAIDMAPLLSEETLAMFASLGETSGRAMAETVFRLFSTHARQGVENLALAVSASDPDSGAIRELAHALKSMCGSAGAERARRQCESLESLAAVGKPVSENAVHRVATTIETTVDAMTDWLESQAAA